MRNLADNILTYTEHFTWVVNIPVYISEVIIIINGATAQSRALASLTGFMTGIL
jgi:hypothetical protein